MPLKDYLHRWYVWYFDTDKILTSYKTRKGECNRCGACCKNLIMGIDCPFLNKKTGLCRIYKYRPLLLCKLPPLNVTKTEFDKHKCLGCTYYWDEGDKK